MSDDPVPVGIRVKFSTWSIVPSNSTWMCAGVSHVLATNAAKQRFAKVWSMFVA